MKEWIKFYCEMRPELKQGIDSDIDVSSLVNRAYREGFKTGAAAMKELATKAAETVIENERVKRN